MANMYSLFKKLFPFCTQEDKETILLDFNLCEDDELVAQGTALLQTHKKAEYYQTRFAYFVKQKLDKLNNKLINN